MTLVNPYAQTQVLIVDDLPGMRSSMRELVAALGIDKITVASSVREGVESVRRRMPDIILCDYYLGDEADGQQFLQYLRERRLISRSVVFVMVTAEQSQEKVMTAAESMPDDYLLKPFTAEALRVRIDRIVERKRRLADIDRLQDQEKWPGVVAGCDAILAARDKFMIDALRIKGHALLKLARYAEAMALYESALALRPFPWARFGLARALRGQGDLDGSTGMLAVLVDESPLFMAAYDCLGENLNLSGRKQEAMAILSRASEKSPGTLSRQRTLAGVAEELGDYAVVERALSNVVKTTRFSPLRDSADAARLSNALMEQGNTGAALAVLADARKVSSESADDALYSAMECVIHSRAGNAEAAAKALDRALLHDAQKLPGPAAVLVARACLVAGDARQGEAIARHVIQNNPDSDLVRSQVSTMLERETGAEAAQHLIEASLGEVVALNNEGVRRAREGDVAGAVSLLQEAAARLPGNAQIVANAAYALLLDVYLNGFDVEKLKSAQTLRTQVVALNPSHAKLRDLDDTLARIRQKYPQGGGA